MDRVKGLEIVKISCVHGGWLAVGWVDGLVDEIKNLVTAFVKADKKSSEAET